MGTRSGYIRPGRSVISTVETVRDKMKFLACFLLLALVGATVVEDTHPTKYVDAEFLQKQKNLYDLVYNVGQQYTADEKIVPDRFNTAKEFFSTHMEKFSKPEIVSQWLKVVKKGLTPKNRSPAFFRWNYNELSSLFNIFYFAKDYETFYQAANWAREHVNEMIFTYALTVAVYQRPDTKGLIMPPYYEVFPSYFTNSKVFMTSYRIKTQGYVSDPKFAESQGVFAHDDKFTYSLTNNFTYEFQNYEQKLAYFTNDVGLNNYYFYFHVNHPSWFGGELYGVKSDRRGEQYYYVHQQLLARYTLERYSNGLGEVPRFFWRKPIPNGYYPDTLTHGGARVPARPDFYDITNEYSDVDILYVEDYERRIRDAIYNGYFTVFGGEKVPLTKPEDIEHLADFIEGNPDFDEKAQKTFFRQYPQIAMRLLGGAVYSNHNVPSALEQYITSTRDPMYYQFANRVLRFFYSFKDTLPSYTKQELFFNGVTVDSVNFTPLSTYFEPYEFDITNGIYQTKEEMFSHKDKFFFQAKQYRLNYKPFTFTMDVTSESEVDSSVRIFLGPKYDSFGHQFDLNTNRFNFVELDFFRYQMKAGKNSISRKSVDFAFTSGDHKPSRMFYSKIKNALQNQQKFSYEQYENDYSWPQNLLLPKGSEGGIEYQVYVIVTPYQPEEGQHFPKYASGEGPEGHFHEVRAFGFPFDRPIDQTVFFTPNTFFSRVTIYHKGYLSANDSYKAFKGEDAHESQ